MLDFSQSHVAVGREILNMLSRLRVSLSIIITIVITVD